MTARIIISAFAAAIVRIIQGIFTTTTSGDSSMYLEEDIPKRPAQVQVGNTFPLSQWYSGSEEQAPVVEGGE